MSSPSFSQLLGDGTNVPCLCGDVVGFDVDEVPGLLESARDVLGTSLGFVAGHCCYIEALGQTVNEVSDFVEWFLIGQNIDQVFQRGRFKHATGFLEKCEHLIV